jgi:hypothetical protein
MRLLRTAALVAAMVGGSLALAGAPASAAPMPASSAPAVAGTMDDGLLTQVQSGFSRHRGYGYGYRRGPRWGYGGPRWGYGGPRWRGHGWGGPPLVCRVRFTPWGPRRVCFRRW